MAERPAAHLIHGYLGAGKTTYAKHLEQRHGLVRFTHDEWMSSLYGDDPPEAQFAIHAARVSDVMDALWTRLLDLGMGVVLDFGFWSRSDRRRVAETVVRHGGRPILHRLACPDAAAWGRIEKRNGDLRGSLHISRDTFDALKARFEPLGADEDGLDVTP